MTSGDDIRRGGGGRKSDTKAATPLERVARAEAPRGGNTDVEMGDTAVASAVAQPQPSAEPSRPDGDRLLGIVLLERYEITRKIGQGGMGAVYEAIHKLIGKRVAVKVLLDKYIDRDAVVARLKQEAQLASSIGHEHIIDITDFGQTDDGRTFVVMEYLEGESLAECLQREGPLPEQRVIRIAHQIAAALGAAHAKGILHRDVKPENVFLLRRNERDFIKVVDFGISKSIRAADESSVSPRLTQTGMVLGTPLYMSPEQARGDDDLDHRIDVYALGAILYEMITGEMPFSGTNYLSVISQVINDEPPPPRQRRSDCSRELETIILKAMDKEREHRYPSMVELAADLAALLEEPFGSGGRPRITATRRKKKSGGNAPLLAWAGAIALVIVGVALAISFTMGEEPSVAEPERIATVVPVADASVATAKPDAMVEEMARIDIVSNPSGATILAQGRILGTTPYTWELPKRDEQIRLIAELDGHDDIEFTINPRLDADETVSLRLKKPRGRPVKKMPIPAAPEPREQRRDDTAGGELGGNPYRR